MLVAAAGSNSQRKSVSIPSGRWRDRYFACRSKAPMERKSRSSGFEVILFASPYHALGAVAHYEAFVARYSGATAQDFEFTHNTLRYLRHPVPYSPVAVTTGTLSQD